MMASSYPPASTPAVPVQAKARFLAGCAAAGVVLAVLGAAAWVWAADPPTSTIERGGGVFFDEQQLNQQVGVTLWFLVIGSVLGLVTGAVIAHRAQAYGVLAVVGVLLTCMIATAASAWLGVQVLGPDQQAQLADATVGTRVTAELDVTTVVAYLGWPVGGMVGALLAIARWPTAHIAAPMDLSSATFVPHQS
jgi:magnesium-transporting ATPase (P-type)